MSLVNEILANLEERRGGRHHDSGIFAGLEAADTEVEVKSRHAKPVYRVMLAAGLLAGVAYFIWEQTQPTPEPQSLAGGVPLSDKKAGNKVAEASYSPRQVRTSLKLDDVLLNTSKKKEMRELTAVNAGSAHGGELRKSSGQRTRVQAVRVQDAGEDINIQLHVSALPEYRSYLLKSPHRLVFDMDTTEFPLEPGDLPDHDWISGIRYRQHDDLLRLVFDLKHPVEIVDKKWTNESDSSLLTLQLRSTMEESVGTTMKADSDAEASAQVMDNGNDDKLSERNVPIIIGDQHMSVTSNKRKRTENSERIYQRALHHYERSDYQRAIREIESYLGNKPDDERALKLYIVALIRTNQVERADRQLYDAVSRLPRAAELKRLYAQRLMQRGSLDDALAILDESPPPLEDEPTYHALVAALKQQLGRHSEAADLYRRLVQMSPDRGVWWLGMAISLEGMKQGNEALTAYREALQRDLSGDLRQYASARIDALSREKTS